MSQRSCFTALRNLAFLTLALLLASAIPVPAKPPVKNPPPAPVHYVIDVIPAPGDGSAFMDVRGTNNLGMIVGQFDDEAYIYDHATGSLAGPSPRLQASTRWVM